MQTPGAVADGEDQHQHHSAHHDSHHTPSLGPPSSLVADNFQVRGHSNMGGGSPHADVYFYDHGGTVGKHVYVGTHGGTCSGVGAKIVDVNNPAEPKLVAYVGGFTGVSNEDVVVIRVGNRDVLGIGVQPCNSQGGVGGLALFDVTSPSKPKALSFTPFPYGVHELDMVMRDDGKALALLAVPFTEFSNTYFGANDGGEFKIVDITNPVAPQLVDDWGYIADSEIEIVAGNDPVSSSFQGIGDYAAYYAHSARAADGGYTAYVSYWDGGVLKFDIADPANPKLLGRTTYELGSDGDAHSLATYEVDGKNYILQNDEDTAAWNPPVVTSSATGTAKYSATEQRWTPKLLIEVGEIAGTVFDANDGCEGTDFAGAAGKIVLVDTVDPRYVGILPGWSAPCDIGSQLLRAARAGARAMLSNLVSRDDAGSYFSGTTSTYRAIQREARELVVVQVSGIDELAESIRSGGPGVTVTMTPSAPTHGFLRTFDESQGTDGDGDGATEWAAVGGFDDAPHVQGRPPPGTWSIHNTEVIGDRAYSSWFSNGIVALDLTDPTAPAMVGQFVPPTSSRYANVLGVGPAEVWGVAIDPATGLVYASDMRTGLWIIEPHGAARPTR